MKLESTQKNTIIYTAKYTHHIISLQFISYVPLHILELY